MDRDRLVMSIMAFVVSCVAAIALFASVAMWPDALQDNQRIVLVFPMIVSLTTLVATGFAVILWMEAIRPR